MAQIRVAKPLKLTAAPKATRKRRSQAEYLAIFLATPAAIAAPDQAEAQRALFERHDPVAWSIRLPLAPSVNHFMIQPRNMRRRIYSSEGRAYKEAVRVFWCTHWKSRPPKPLTGRLRLLVVVHMARNGEADISNRIKPLEDALADCGAYATDGQIDELRVLRGEVVPGTGAMDVTIETISE